MANKYKDTAEATNAPIKQEKAVLTGAEAEAESAAKNTMNPILGNIGAAAEGVLDAVPGAKYLQTKALQAFGVDPADTVAAQHRLTSEYPAATGAGAGTGAALVAAGTGGALGLPAAAGGALGAAAVGASEAGLMTPIYKLGDILNDAEAVPTPLSVEQVSHAFDMDDVLTASGIAALLHAPGLLTAGVQKGTRMGAEASAGGALKKASNKLQRSDLGRLALDTGMLEEAGKAKKLADKAGKEMGAALKGVEIDSVARENLVEALGKVSAGGIEAPAVKGAARKVAKAAEALAAEGEMDAERAWQHRNALKDLRDAAPKGSQTKLLYGDAVAAFDQALESHVTAVDPIKGRSFTSAKQDYKTYINMVREADAAANKRLTGKDIATGVAIQQGSRAAGAAIGGPAGAMAADAISVGGMLWKNRAKNPAVLLNKISKIAPGAAWNGRVGDVVEGLLSPNLVAQNVGDRDTTERYDQMAKDLRNHVANPDAAAQALRQNMNFLPPVMADAVTANTMEKINKMCAELPEPTGPATAFGIQTQPSDREKREFLRKCDAKFDPYSAILSGRKDLIQEAERCNPETVHEIKKAIIDRISKNPDSIDYMTRRKICGILGLPGVPGQDAAIGARIQAALTNRRVAQDSQGQMKSARQANANLKNNSATLSRAQKILNNGE